MAKASNPILLLMVIAGLATGLWLAAHTGGESGTDASADIAPAGNPEAGRAEPARAQAAEIALDPAEPRVLGRQRPRPHAHDAGLMPGPDETCLSILLEASDGSVPRGASVALFALEDQHPRFPPIAVFDSDQAGLVRVCAKLEGESEIVAFAPGWKPVGRRVMPRGGERVDLEPLVLDRGATIRGRVTAGSVPLVRAEIEATATAPAYEARLDAGRIGWRAGRYTWCSMVCETDASGAYTISGLEPGEHVVRLCAVRQRDVAIDIQKVATRRSIVPAADVDFALPAARLDLSFESSGTPLCCVDVQIEAGERQFMRRTDDFGRIGFMIQPEVAYQVTAGRMGFTTKRAQLRGLTDGERRPETIALEPRTELANLIVDVRGTLANDRATFELRPRFLPGQPEPAIVRTVERDARSRKFIVPNVPAGSWRVTLRSGVPLLPLSPSALSNCEQDFVVDVPDTGSIEVTATVLVRGGLFVTARLESGERVRPSVQLLDTDGASVDSVVVLDKPLFGTDPFPVPADSWPVFIYSGWCAGSADIVVSAEGTVPTTTRASFSPNRITPVDVTLRRK